MRFLSAQTYCHNIFLPLVTVSVNQTTSRPHWKQQMEIMTNCNFTFLVGATRTFTDIFRKVTDCERDVLVRMTDCEKFAIAICYMLSLLLTIRRAGPIFCLLCIISLVTVAYTNFIVKFPGFFSRYFRKFCHHCLIDSKNGKQHWFWRQWYCHSINAF
jgi:hypothetical protein